MTSDNIFSGLKVVDLASFIAGPSAAVILSDFGAEVIKVEPPTGDLWRHAHKIPPQPQAEDAYPWHLANRNKRGITLDLKSPSAQQVLQELVTWADVLIVNTPHPARKRLKLEYDDVVLWNPRLIYADVTGFGEKGPDADLPGFDITSYWARSGLLSMTRDAGEPPTWPVAGSGDNATAVGRPDLLTDPRLGYPAKLIANMPHLTAILDEVFGAQPMAHWYEVFSGIHVTFGAVRAPQEVIEDPQLRANDIVVPLEGAGGKLTSTISSPIQVHGVTKVSAKRAPELGEHNEEILQELGFDTKQIDSFLASGTITEHRELALK